MNNTKKFLALIISVVICVSCVTAFAGDFETDLLPIGSTTKKTTTSTTTTTTTKPTTNSDVHETDPATIPSSTTTKPASTAVDFKGSVSLSKNSYTYNGKVKNPTVIVKDNKGNAVNKINYSVSTPSGRKNVGKYTYKITFKNKYKKSTKSVSFTIKPTDTYITSLSRGSKKFTVKWAKKTTQVTGYQIRYSIYSSFKNSTTKTVTSSKTTSKTISSLKSNKKYYVKVRTYKTVNGKKYYSSWSKAKSVTTK